MPTNFGSNFSRCIECAARQWRQRVITHSMAASSVHRQLFIECTRSALVSVGYTQW